MSTAVWRWLGASCVVVACGDRAPVPPLLEAAPPPVPDAAVVAPRPPPPSPVDATLTLTAVCDPGASDAAALDISLSIPAGPPPVFQLDDRVMGTAGMAALITDATAEDARGELPLDRRVHDGVLSLTPSRPATGGVTLRYRARSIAADAPGAVEGLRHDATGIGGLGQHFLVLPDRPARYAIRIAWGSSSCATRGAGASTFGGAAPSETSGTLDALRAAVYYWGRPQQTATDDGTLHLRTAWFGAPVLDVAAAGAWAAHMFAAERAFFADDDPTPYSIFARVLQSHGDRANGVGQETSFLSWLGPRTPFARRLQVNLAHEMLHRWLGLRLRLRGPEGSAYWFTEGFTVHYSNVIAFRAGLLSTEAFLESINDIATRHFDNPHAGASNAEIRRRFYDDPAVSIVPYTRGALYAAELDAALRATSRSLDDSLRQLYVTSRAPANRAGLPADAIRRLVQTALGRAGVARYDAVIVRGRDPDPPTGAYGPCFARQPRAPRGFTWVKVASTPDVDCRRW